MIHPRVVLDTNCLLQILGAKSKYHFLVDLFLANEYTLCLSTEIIFEYEVIKRHSANMEVLSTTGGVSRTDAAAIVGTEDDNNDIIINYTDGSFLPIQDNNTEEQG